MSAPRMSSDKAALRIGGTTVGAGASSEDLQRDGEQQRHVSADVPAESKKI
jgi:hypothetical protein